MSTGTAFNTALGGGAGPAGAGNPSGGQQNQYASPIGQDRLIRKETSLGIIREKQPPLEHIGLTIAPWLEVATDEVVFSYLGGLTDGLAPARAETAEAELAQKDENALGMGRASVIDWSLKDHYTASDVNRARELARMVEQMQQGGSVPLFAASATEDWAGKISRDRNLRRRKLDNRIEKLIMDALSTGLIVYNDGKIKFSVDYGRPANQQAGNAANDPPTKYRTGVVDGVWDISGTTFDPIGFFNGINDWFFDVYGVRFNRVIGSRLAFNSFINTDKFAQRAGLGTNWAGGVAGPPDPRYLIDGWGPQAVRDLLQNITGYQFIEYDSVYRTRPIGSGTITNNRFLPQNRLIFLPDESTMAEVDGTQIGFAKTLTAPHPEGNWQAGFYEWERSTIDPWGQDMGNGVKAFPVFPYMEYSYAVDVVLPT